MFCVLFVAGFKYKFIKFFVKLRVCVKTVELNP